MPLDRRDDRPRNTLAALLPFLILSGLAGTARCQTSADVTFVSEYAARGLALDTHPALQLRVEHDTAAGWYAGAFASPVALPGRRQGELVAYGGRAGRLTSSLSWDAGVTRTAFLRDGGFSYHEWYAGLALPRAGARLFYSPAYYGEGRTLYLDLNGAWPLDDRWSVAAHAGLLHPLGAYEGVAGSGADARLALVADVGDWSLQAGWQVKGNAYLPGVARARALTAGASLRF